jgi:transcriptional regulator
MYIPASFAETDPTVLHDFMRQHSFALLVSNHDGESFATHLPLLLDRDAGPHGRLVGHTARANPQWRQADGQSVLAVFSGPHAYISPAWYEAQNVVPTWNYTAVHTYGTFTAIHDEDQILQIVERTVTAYEQPRALPWTMDGSRDYARKLAGAVVGFHIELTRIEGKFKLSQNQPAERQQKVVDALQQQHDANSVAIAAIMQTRLRGSDHPGMASTF